MNNTYWALLTMEVEVTPLGCKIVCTTDVPCHLFMRWSYVAPKQHIIPVLRRGLFMHADKYFCFDVYHDNEQNEFGDSLIHTFIKEPWAVCETRYFYFHGTIGGIASPSTSAIFKHHRLAVETLYEFYVSLGPGASNVFANFWTAQTFTPTIAHEITRVRLLLCRFIGTPSGVKVSIRRTDGAGHPTGTDLCAHTIDGDDLIEFPNFEWYFIPFTYPYLLNAGVKYAIVIRAPSGSMPVDFIQVNHSTIAPVYLGGNVEASIDSGATWTTHLAVDHLFEEWGYPVP